MIQSINLEGVGFSYKEPESKVFSNINLELPNGLTSFVGQNGTGKSTLLLLAGGRLLPDFGKVMIHGIDTKNINTEEQRNQLVSVIYQNMEFETEDSIGDLLEYVYSQGQIKNVSLIDEITSVFQLKNCLGKKFQENSKGDMQKISIAFSLLYGSPYVMMDEPVFALENKWKELVLEFLQDYTNKNSISIYYSIHELDLSRKYSDNTLLFSKDKSILMGPTTEILIHEIIEKAYQVPMELLYKREMLFREHLEKPPIYSSVTGQNVTIIE